MNDGELTSKSETFKKEDSELDKTGSKLERSLSFKNWESSIDDPIVEPRKSGSDSLVARTCERIRITKPTISLPQPVILFSPRPVTELDAAAIKLQKVYNRHTISKSEIFKKEESEPDKSGFKVPTISLPEPFVFFSPRPVTELDAAAIKLQKVYKSYRTRRNLADCAVVVEELWWKTLDAATLKLNSVSFFETEKHETAVSKWARAKTRAAKVGKGLSKDEKAQKLALQHWLEAIDPRHRYGHNLHFYYDVWSESKSCQPFFYWLDIGDGKDVNLEKCPRSKMQRQSIKYLGPKERESFEVIVERGRLVYRQSGKLLDTSEDSKWIFVLSTSRALYVGQKIKGVFQHSSFLSGGATTAAGRLVAHDGTLEAIWPYSGHYLPTEDNFKEFLTFLEEHHVDLTNVKRCSIDDDYPSFKSTADEEYNPGKPDASTGNPNTGISEETIETDSRPVYNLGNHLSCKWTSGVGPRIGCVRDYPISLQTQALEHVKLSPRVSSFGSSAIDPSAPIPSPRPNPKFRVSPRLAYMGIPSPRVHVNA